MLQGPNRIVASDVLCVQVHCPPDMHCVSTPALLTCQAGHSLNHELLCRRGGRGAVISGTFRLEAGQELRILCGGMSALSPQGSSGGGGATFVMRARADLPLVVAGGGGGTRCANHAYFASSAGRALAGPGEASTP